MDCGWIKVYRQMLSWQWWNDSNMVHLFLHLLLTVNVEATKWRDITVSRGQVIVTRKSLSKATNISERTIRTCLDRLEKSGEIDQQTTNKYTIITICKFDSYQQSEKPNRPAIRQQPTNNRPTTDQQNKVSPTPPSNRKEYKNTRIYYYSSSPAHTREEQEQEQLFFIFYLKGSSEPRVEVANFLTWNQAPSRFEDWNRYPEYDRYVLAEQGWKVKKKFSNYKERSGKILTMIIRNTIATNPDIMSGIFDSKKYPLNIDGSTATLTCTEEAHKAIESNMKAISGRLHTAGINSLVYNIIEK